MNIDVIATAIVNWVTTNFEPIFSKNTAFNKNFGTTAGTVCEGNDIRIGEWMQTPITPSYNPLDSTTYYTAIFFGTPLTTSGAFGVRMMKTGTINNFTIVGSHVTADASGLSTSIYLRNITTATDYPITTAWLENYAASSQTVQSYSGLGIPIGNTTDIWNIKIVTPVYAPNPTTVQYCWGFIIE